MATPPRVTHRPYGRTAEGVEVDLYELRTGRGLSAEVSTFGGVVTSLRVPDRAGRLGDVVLGFPSLDGYLATSTYFGALIGRYGNRIAGGRFALGGKTYALARNNGANHLHGGLRGFDKVVWRARPLEEAGRAGVVLSYLSRDGEEGYPGNLAVEVTCALTEAGELTFDYEARTDAPTPVNLTHHGYFNLEGAGSGSVLDHQLTLHASRFTPVDAGLIPTGALAPVEGTPFDFRRPAAVGARIGAADPQLANGGGYDHNFVLDRAGAGLALAARLVAPRSGRAMEVLTTEPAIQFYSGNFLDGSVTGKERVRYQRRDALCLEAQHYPDSPNQPAFPSTVLQPGDTYRSATVYRFGVEG